MIFRSLRMRYQVMDVVAVSCIVEINICKRWGTASGVPPFQFRTLRIFVSSSKRHKLTTSVEIVFELFSGFLRVGKFLCQPFIHIFAKEARLILRWWFLSSWSACMLRSKWSFEKSLDSALMDVIFKSHRFVIFEIGGGFWIKFLSNLLVIWPSIVKSQ